MPHPGQHALPAQNPPRPPRPPRARRAGSVAAVIAAAILPAALFAPGCSNPLLSATDERTPFDRYDALRNQYARQYIENEFGHKEPNLRGRLAPK